MDSKLSAGFYIPPMISPESTKGKTGSNWLDRLRSAKGFLNGDAPNLDHLPPVYTDAVHSRQQTLLTTPDDNGDGELGGLVTNILSDLFCMGAASSQNPKLKFPRKQPNPKSFSLALRPIDNNYNTEYGVVPSSNSDNSTKNGEFQRTGNLGWGDVEEEENSEKELAGYSRSEVTVIDTSCDVWNSDRLVFRKRNVWKIRSKKGKLRSYGGKKRKHDLHGTFPGNNLRWSHPGGACRSRLSTPTTNVVR